MTASGSRHLAGTSKIALALAAGTTAAVGAAVVTGREIGAPEAIGAFTVAGAIAVLNVRASRPKAQPHVLSAPPADVTGPAVVAAPRASEVATQPAAHTDAA